MTIRSRHAFLIIIANLLLIHANGLEMMERWDGENFLDYLKRVDSLYCSYEGFCESSGISSSTSLSFSSCGPGACEISCKCDEQCSRYEDCCPDIPPFPTGGKIPKLTCRSRYIKREKLNTDFYYMVSECRSDYYDKTTIYQCEKSQESDSLLAHTPVTVNNSLTYINRYCAICNGEQLFETWTRSPSCNGLVHIPSFMQKNEIENFFYRHPFCNIELKPPSESVKNSLRTCGADDRYVISECNVTGKWQKYDKDIEDACLYYKQALDTNYRNPFCYVCNTDNPHYDCDNKPPTAAVTNRPMTALLDFTADEYERPRECNRGESYDFTKKICREIFCADGQWLSDEVTCVNILNPGSDVLFKVFIVYRVEGGPFDCPPEVLFQREIANSLESMFVPDEFTHKYAPHGGVIVGFCHPMFSESRARLSLHDIVLQMEFEYIGRGDLNLSETDHLFLNWTFQSRTISLLSQELKLVPNSPRTVNITRLFREVEDSSEIDRHSTLIATYFSFGFGIKRPQIVINRQRTCPYVILSPKEFVENGTLVRLESIDYDVPLGEFSIINDTKIAICSEPYFSRLEKLRPHRQSQKDDKALVILSIVCTSLSMVCLLLTFVVYCLVKTLQSLPGKNNMALIICLFLAQAVFQLRMERSDGSFACNAWGILTHYTWLSALLWMNICSFHMCRVFGHLKTVGHTNKLGADIKNLLLYMLYCQTVPIIFIIIVIVRSRTQLDTTGYDSPFCFISSKQLLGYTFALPIGIVVVSNVVMFIIVVVSIYRSASSTKMAKADRNYLNVYFRLSTLTGTMWIFGFIDQWTDNVVISYLFVIFNALQGVFIFIAFVCNRRIYNSLKKKFASSQPHTSSSAYTMSTRTTSTNSKVTRSNDPQT